MLEWGKVFGDSNFPRLRFPTKRSFNAEATLSFCHVFLIRSCKYHKVPNFWKISFHTSDSNLPFCVNFVFLPMIHQKYAPTTYGVSYSATPSEHPVGEAGETAHPSGWNMTISHPTTRKTPQTPQKYHPKVGITTLYPSPFCDGKCTCFWEGIGLLCKGKNQKLKC